MKSYLYLALLIVFVLVFTDCNNGAAEKAKADCIEKADSIAKVDFIAKAEANAGIEAGDTLAKEVNLKTNTPKDKKFVKTGQVKFKVNSVVRASERIEDLAAKYDGYLTYSNLRNAEARYAQSRISRDSVMAFNQIVVENSIRLRIPNVTLDSFIRSLNSLVVFLDYRVIRMEDVTLQSAINAKRASRLANYSARQQKHIDTKESKLKETAPAEENLLEHQNQADDLQIKNLELEDRMKYCDLSIEIYQKPVIVKEKLADFERVTDYRIGFMPRAWESIVQGWIVLEEITIILLKIWGVVALILVLVLGYRSFRRLLKNRKK